MAVVLFISFVLLATQVTAQAGKHCCIIVTNRHYNNASQNLLADCINSTLRLSMETDDGASIKGLPEYCYSGAWRRICMVNGETRAEAETKQKQACKQLGYSAKSGEILDRAPFVYNTVAQHHFTRTAAGYR